MFGTARFLHFAVPRRGAGALHGSPCSSWRRVQLRSAHQRLPVCPDVDLVVVDDVQVHGNKRHPAGALCAAMTTDGLRSNDQQEVAWLVQYPFAKPGVIPEVVANTVRYVRSMNEKGVFIRDGDVLDMNEKGSIGAFGSLGDVPAKAVCFSYPPLHDEYWLGDHEFRLPPYPVLLASILLEGERSLCGYTGGTSRVLAAFRGYWNYAPGLPFVPAKRLNRDDEHAEPTESLRLEDGGDVALRHPLLRDTSHVPSPARLNGAYLVMKPNMLTLTIPTGTGDLVYDALAETAARRQDEEVTLITDFPPPSHTPSAALTIPFSADADGAAVSSSLDALSLIPMKPSTGKSILRQSNLSYTGSGVILGYFSDEHHVDAIDAASQSDVSMRDAETCVVTLSPNHPDLFSVKLRHRAWLRVLKAFAQKKGYVCPSAEANAPHFEIRWTNGDDIPLWQAQVGRGQATLAAMRREGLDAFSSALSPQAEQADCNPGSADDAKVPSPTHASEPVDPATGGEHPGVKVVELGSAEPGRHEKRVFVLDGPAAAAAATQKLDKAAMTPEDQHKVRIAGRGDLLRDSVGDTLPAPLSASQYEKYAAELGNHRRLAQEVKAGMSARAGHALEGNIIRVVWSYDESDPKGLESLTAELKAVEQAWLLWKQRLVSVVMLHLEQNAGAIRLPDSPRFPDLSPNVCVRVLSRTDTAADRAVFGVLVKDDLLSETSPLVEALDADEQLADCPVDCTFDLFLNVARRGTYARARQRTTRWEDMEAHYQSLSDQAAERLASLEAEHQKLRLQQAEIERQKAEIEELKKRND